MSACQWNKDTKGSSKLQRKTDVGTDTGPPDIFTLFACVALFSWLHKSSLIKQWLWSEETLQATYVCNAQNTPPSFLLCLKQLGWTGEWYKLSEEAESVLGNTSPAVCVL